MYSIIQKIYEKHKEILKEGVKKVFNGEDVSSLTGAIKRFTDNMGEDLLAEIVGQIDKVIFDDEKRSQEFESVRFSEKSLISVVLFVKARRQF